jgi:hypothetical protein
VVSATVLVCLGFLCRYASLCADKQEEYVGGSVGVWPDVSIYMGLREVLTCERMLTPPVSGGVCRCV